MKTLIFLIALIATSTVFAGPLSRVPATSNKLNIECVSPEGFAGLTATVSGTLQLKSLPSGAAEAKGKLKISLLNPRSPWKGEKQVLGQYDDLTSVQGERYFHGGTTINGEDDIMVVYVNFTNKDTSYVEYAGVTYKISCK